jgi:hypothetical protein
MMEKVQNSLSDWNFSDETTEDHMESTLILLMEVDIT